MAVQALPGAFGFPSLVDRTDIMDRANLAQQVVALRLATPAQVEECLQEVGNETPEAEPLLRAMERKEYLTVFQTDKLRRGDREGYFLGGFRIKYRVASGSFGRVYRGDEPGSGRIVAIKELRKRWSDDPAAVELFMREGRVGMSLRHPNIVEILAVGQDPVTRRYYITMEFVEGGNLRDLLAIRKKFEPPEALRLMEEMASSLAYAFARGVTHRDIKLTNILISTQGAAKLVDFGLARMYRPTGGRHHKGEDNEHVQRTVDYAGIEKATGVPPGDVRSDIFFLGCVLYEMLTGRPPMPPTRDKHARMQRERFTHVPPIQPEEVNAPPAVLRLVETMMAFNPQQRQQTPAQLVEAIREGRIAAEGSATAGAGVNHTLAAAQNLPTVFVVERDERLQNLFREKLKKSGYRVLIAADPARALERFSHQSFQGLVVDAGTVEEEGVRALKFMVNQAKDKGLPFGGVLIVSEDQKDYADAVQEMPDVSVLRRPLKLGQLVRVLHERVPLDSQNSKAESREPPETRSAQGSKIDRLA